MERERQRKIIRTGVSFLFSFYHAVGRSYTVLSLAALLRGVMPPVSNNHVTPLLHSSAAADFFPFKDRGRWLSFSGTLGETPRQPAP